MPMERTSLFFDRKSMISLKREANRRGVSVAAIVREAVAAYILGSSSSGKLPSVTGRFASGQSDTSARTDELLWVDPHT